MTCVKSEMTFDQQLRWEHILEALKDIEALEQIVEQRLDLLDEKVSLLNERVTELELNKETPE